MYCVHSSDRPAHYNSRKKQLHSKLASEGKLDSLVAELDEVYT